MTEWETIADNTALLPGDVLRVTTQDGDVTITVEGCIDYFNEENNPVSRDGFVLGIRGRGSWSVKRAKEVTFRPFLGDVIKYVTIDGVDTIMPNLVYVGGGFWAYGPETYQEQDITKCTTTEGIPIKRAGYRWVKNT